jgi:tRNA A37 methylthiotransferase MiaB
MGFKMKRVDLISLGCEKNLVDSEMILGLINKGKV